MHELPLLPVSCFDGNRVQSVRGYRAQQTRLTGGEGTLLIVGEPDANHTRCAVCGSLLFSVVRDGAFVHVAMGSLVDAPSIRPTEHIYVGSKAPWFEITDGLPQHQELE